MNRFKKLMSVLITAVMLLQMVGIVGQVSATPSDIVLDVADGNSLADGVAISGTFKNNYVPVGGMVDWATTGCVILNSAAPYVTWEFNVPVAGVYNIWIAYANSAKQNVTAYRVTTSKDIDISGGVSANIYPNDGSVSGDNMLLRPVETMIAASKYFTKGTNKLKIKASTGALFNVKLEYAHETDFLVLGDSSISGSNGGYGNSAGGTAPELGILNTGSGFLLGTNTNMSYPVEILKSGCYRIKTIGSKYSGTGSVDIYDSFDGGEENKIVSALAVNTGSTASSELVVNSSELVNLKEGSHILRVDGVSSYAFFNGFMLEYLGKALELESIKANTSDVALSEGDTISKGADTFKIKFSKDVVGSTVNANTVYLADGDNKIDTVLSANGDEAGLTVKKVLEPSKMYTIVVDGVQDDLGLKLQHKLNVVAGTDVDVVSVYHSEATATNKIIEGSADENKRDVTVTAKLLASDGKTGIEGRAVEMKLNGSTVWEGVSAADGAVVAKYIIPAEAGHQTFSFKLAGEGVTTEKEVTLTYVTTEYEKSLLGPLKTATKDDIKAFIENTGNQTIFGIDPASDMPAYSGFDKDKVYAQLEMLDAEDATAFKAAYTKAILVETINQANSSAAARTAVANILSSDTDCSLLGINKDKSNYIDVANEPAFVNAVIALNVSDPAKTFDEEVKALADAIDAEIDNILKTQYGKTDSTPLVSATSTSYLGMVFDVSLDVTPAQANMEKIEYVVEASEETILADATVETVKGYKAETEVVDGKLVITVVAEDAPTTLSTDLAVGTLKNLNTPGTAGTYTISISGKVSYDEGIPYIINTNITPTVITLTAKENTSEGSFSSSSSSSGGTASKPKPQEKPEETKPEEKPSVVTPPAEEKPVSNFKDLAGNEWAIEAINTLFDKGIISDNAEKSFRPNDNVTREEFVKMIIEALGLVHETYETELNDVEKGAWYYPYVATAVEKGIVLGDENGNFRIGEKISRQDMAVIIIRVLTKLEHPYDTKSAKFADDKEISDYAKDAMYAAKNLAIINGVGDNMCAPKGTATRAMAAKVIYEMMRTVGLK